MLPRQSIGCSGRRSARSKHHISATAICCATRSPTVARICFSLRPSSPPRLSSCSARFTGRTGCKFATASVFRHRPRSAVRKIACVARAHPAKHLFTRDQPVTEIATNERHKRSNIRHKFRTTCMVDWIALAAMLVFTLVVLNFALPGRNNRGQAN